MSFDPYQRITELEAAVAERDARIAKLESLLAIALARIDELEARLVHPNRRPTRSPPAANAVANPAIPAVTGPASCRILSSTTSPPPAVIASLR